MAGEVHLRSLSAVVCLSAVLLLPFRVSAETRKPVVEGIRGKIQGREARVQFSLRNAFPPEMVEALKAGIEISFRVQVRVERVYHGWFNRTVGEAAFTRSVRYDALSRVYRLRQGGKDETLTTVFDALRAMSEYDTPLPVSVEPERGKPYRAYVKIRLDRAGLSESLRIVRILLSWDIETEWARGYLATP